MEGPQHTHKPSLDPMEGPVEDFKITGEPWGRLEEKSDTYTTSDQNRHVFENEGKPPIRDQKRR